MRELGRGAVTCEPSRRGADQGRDDAIGPDLADDVVVGVGDEQAPIVEQLDVGRSRERRLLRRATIARISSGTTAGHGLDAAVGVDAALERCVVGAAGEVADGERLVDVRRPAPDDPAATPS